MKFHNSVALFAVVLGVACLVSNEGVNSYLVKRAQGGYNVVSSVGAEEYQQKFLQLFNQYRRNHGLHTVTLDSSLTRGAQAWAEHEAETQQLVHSCTHCDNYAEVLAKRRSSRKLPEGVDAAEWVYSSWFGEEDDTYDSISLNPNLRSIGLGVAYIRTRDKAYHAYGVGRFAT